MNWKSWRLAVGGVALLALLAFSLAACGKDDKSSNTEIASAINIIDKAGLHDIDDSINTKQTIPASAKTTAEHLRVVVLLTDWPSDLKEPARKLAKTFGDMAAALDGEKPDMAKAGAAAHAAHEGAHDFSHAVWEHLQKEAGVGTGAAHDD